MTRHQLGILDLSRLQSLGHLPERINELRSHVAHGVRLPPDRPHDPTDGTLRARLGLAPMERGQKADRIVHDVRVRSAQLDERTAWQPLHDERSNIREILDRLRESRRPSSFAE